MSNFHRKIMNDVLRWLASGNPTCLTPPKPWNHPLWILSPPGARAARRQSRGAHGGRNGAAEAAPQAGPGIADASRISGLDTVSDWWFPIYWEFHHPNWLIFFRGVETTKQICLDYAWIQSCPFVKKRGAGDWYTIYQIYHHLTPLLINQPMGIWHINGLDHLAIPRYPKVTNLSTYRTGEDTIKPW